MPNWSENVLEINNLSKESYDKLISEYTKQEERCERTLVFDKIIPLPRDENGNIIEGDDGWYYFCINNWGTKWEPNTYSFESSYDEQCGGHVCIGMDTAWTPPIGIVKKLSELFPEAELIIKYVEPGCCFMGEKHFSNGEETYNMYSEDLDELKKAYPEFWEDEDEEEDDTKELIDEKIKQDIAEEAASDVADSLKLDEEYQQEEYKGL